MSTFPSDWRPLRAKYLYRVVDERDGGTRLPLLAVSIHHGVVPRESLTEDEPRADDLSNYKRCAAGNIVINRMRAFQGAIGLAPVAGIVSPDYVVLRLVDSLEPRYFHHLFRSRWFVGEMTARLRGIGGSDQGNVRTPRINIEDFGEIRVRMPPLRAQREIADFLDAETARIEALIEKKLRMIELFDEAWKTELAAAFDPSTGVRLKHLLAAPLAYGVLVPEHDEAGVPMLRITDLRTETVDLESVARIPTRQSLEYRRTVVGVGDLVVSVVGTLGRSIEVSTDLAGCNLNRALARVQLQRGVPRNLIRFWFESELFADQARLATSSDSAQATLGLGDMKDFSVGLPSNWSLWPRMTARLESRRARLGRAASVLRHQVGLLREHREALITAAVNGQLDIAKSAA